MPDRQSPLVRRRRLARMFRGLRQDPVTATDIAARLGWPTSRLPRIERGEAQRGVSLAVVERILAAHQVTDPADRERFLTLAPHARRGGSWTTWPALPPRFAELIAYETEASTVRVWNPSSVPGLLQTPEYAGAVFAARAGASGARTDHLVPVHEERVRRLLHGDDPATVHAVMGEEALRRVVGG